MNMPADYLIFYKSYNYQKQGVLNCPTEMCYGICQEQIIIFERIFKNYFHEKHILKVIQEKCIIATNISHPNWYNQCAEHKIKILKFMLLVLIRKHCQWKSEKQQKSNADRDKMKVLRS